jgi:hypothetical protein
MLPTLFPGDLLNVHAEPLSAIQTGDVVLFARQVDFSSTAISVSSRRIQVSCC